MSCHYSFYLRVGFKVPLEAVQAPFRHKDVLHEEGVFHMEDRFDPKTGSKLEPVKVWDRKPKNKTTRWWVIDGERFDDWEDEVMTGVFAEKLGCYVDNYWQAYGDDHAFGFYLHDPNNNDQVDFGRGNLMNTTMDYGMVCAMAPQLVELKNRLQALGINPGEAQVFLGEVSG